jgi:hypothetical protein
LDVQREALRELGEIRILSELKVSDCFILPSLYRQPIRDVNNVSAFQSPLEKINCWITSISNMKTEVVDHWKGKITLDSKDDETLIFTYVLIFSSLPTLLAELAFL